MYSNKSRLIAFLLCLFLGEFGIHRFYVGKVGTGMIWLISGGLLEIGWIIDLVMIIAGSFEDKNGNKLVDW